METRELLTAQEFDGENCPVVRVSAFKALQGDEKWAEQIMKLMDAVDDYIPQPERDTDKPFLMPVEDVFTITGRGTVVTGRIERGVITTGETVGSSAWPTPRPPPSPVSRCSARSSTRVRRATTSVCCFVARRRRTWSAAWSSPSPAPPPPH